MEEGARLVLLAFDAAHHGSEGHTALIAAPVEHSRHLGY